MVFDENRKNSIFINLSIFTIVTVILLLIRSNFYMWDEGVQFPYMLYIKNGFIYSSHMLNSFLHYFAWICSYLLGFEISISRAGQIPNAFWGGLSAVIMVSFGRIFGYSLKDSVFLALPMLVSYAFVRYMTSGLCTPPAMAIGLLCNYLLIKNAAVNKLNFGNLMLAGCLMGFAGVNHIIGFGLVPGQCLLIVLMLEWKEKFRTSVKNLAGCLSGFILVWGGFSALFVITRHYHPGWFGTVLPNTKVMPENIAQITQALGQIVNTFLPPLVYLPYEKAQFIFFNLRWIVSIFVFLLIPIITIFFTKRTFYKKAIIAMLVCASGPMMGMVLFREYWWQQWYAFASWAALGPMLIFVVKAWDNNIIKKMIQLTSVIFLIYTIWGTEGLIAMTGYKYVYNPSQVYIWDARFQKHLFSPQNPFNHYGNDFKKDVAEFKNLSGFWQQ